MFSTVLEILGFAALIAATFLVGGLVAALFVTGPVLLLLGYAIDDERSAVALSRVFEPVRRRRAAWRAGRELRRRKLAKAG